MPNSASVQRSTAHAARILAELASVRDGLVGPDGSDPAVSPPLGPEDNVVEMCAAVYAMPEQFRELSRTGIPLMWSWPSKFYSQCGRRDQLLLAGALILTAIERIDLGESRSRRHLQIVDADAETK